jgi:hypothetical protein
MLVSEVSKKAGMVEKTRLMHNNGMKGAGLSKFACSHINYLRLKSATVLKTFSGSDVCSTITATNRIVEVSIMWMFRFRRMASSLLRFRSSLLFRFRGHLKEVASEVTPWWITNVASVEKDANDLDFFASQFLIGVS